MYKRFIIVFLIIIATALWHSKNILSDSYNKINNDTIPQSFLKDVDYKWVDSVFNTLTPEERISQLMIIHVYSNKDKKFYDEISELIAQYNIGGVTFFQGGPVMQAKLTNRWQSEAKTPLLVSIDGEWGIGMRMKDSAVSFPRQMTLGAIQNDSLIYEMGAEIARQCKRIGIHINFAPVLDINNNPLNPVINSRSFGESKYNVAKKGIMYIKGMQDNNILATGKHFPGHGDTKHDSHKTLPIIYHNKAMIDTFDIYPFARAMNAGLGSIMLAHLYIPALDSTPKLASSLSPIIVNGYLKTKIGYDGLIMTDGLAMKGVTDYYKHGELEVKALAAGNDILLLPENVPIAIKAIKKAISDGILSQNDINNKCKKVLAYKYQLGLYKKQHIEVNNIYNDINTISSEILNRKLYQNSIILVKNNNNLIPLERLDTLKIASVSLGANKQTKFQNILHYYSKMDNYYLDKNSKSNEYNELINKLKKYNLVIIGIHDANQQVNKNYNITNEQISFINQLKSQTNIILNLFANPYSLALFEDTTNIDAIIISHQSNKYTENASAQIIFGGMSVSGKLPISAGNFKEGQGYTFDKRIRLGYSIPEELNINSFFEKKVDSLINEAIIDSFFPGCQVLYAYKGQVFLNKSYGKFTYAAKSKNVENTDLYDLASLTKVLATTAAIMKLYEENKIDIDKTLGDYLDFLKNSNKSSLKIREVMAHQARLKSWIPFYKETLKNGTTDTSIYNKYYNEKYSYIVSNNIYIRNDYKDTIYKRIADSELQKQKKYLYSDNGFILLKLIIEEISTMNFDNYVQNIFYKPLGLSTMTFNPLNTLSINNIAPTEYDKEFRKQLIQGYVHDQAAAMLGGVSGHAGLFSNANDIAIMLQMLLQNGEYGNERYFKQATINEFTKYQFPFNNNRRGLGFDKPIADTNNRQTCKSATLNSFGHTGFTGTYFWVDPNYDYIFVFLSNRLYPDASNNKLLKNSTRSILHQMGYDAIKSIE